jgi:hypothetical protein
LTKAALVLAASLAVGACARPPAAPGPSDAAAEAPRASFVNRVWIVKESSAVEPGMLYVFLSDGTLVMTSPRGKPALGTWTPGKGTFTMVEEGQPHRVDVLSLTDAEFRIRSHNPGEPVDIVLVPAPSDQEEK